MRLSSMKLSLFLGCVLLSILVAASGHTFDSRLNGDWKIWKSQHEKQYTEEEETHRRSIWEDNVRYIEQHNLEYSMGKHTFTVGMNEFGDLTNKEFSKRMNGFLPVKADNSTEEVNEDDEFSVDEESDDDLRGASVNWHEKGYVTPVRNQGKCGSCWAFSAVGAIEGQWFRKTRKLIPLSEQDLVDCSTSFGNHGCRGGWMSQAFEYVVRNRGINTAQDYPYTGQDERCRFERKKFVEKLRHYAFVRNCRGCLEQALRRIGPISVAIDAGGRGFQLYKTGIYQSLDCSNTQVNHAVLLVGLGSENGMNYWLVKNSWGTGWGDAGYIKMARGLRINCGITNYAVFPIV
ncbi:procathepsin L-like isoform X2 [Mustelus asterias]